MLLNFLCEKRADGALPRAWNGIENPNSKVQKAFDYYYYYFDLFNNHIYNFLIDWANRDFIMKNSED